MNAPYHWQIHGTADLLPRSERETPGALSVHTQQHPSVAGGRVHVVQEISMGPFTLAARMTGSEARALAALLLGAADAAAGTGRAS